MTISLAKIALLVKDLIKEGANFRNKLYKLENKYMVYFITNVEFQALVWMRLFFFLRKLIPFLSF